MMKNETAEIKRKIMEFAKKNAPLLLVIIVGAVLILLPTGKNSAQKSSSEEAAYNDENVFSLNEMEKKLEKLLSEVAGAGEVKVMLTLKTGAEKVIAQNEKKSGSSSAAENDSGWKEDIETSAVIVESGGDESVVTVKYIFPEYQGAVIVAQGADIASVKLKITEAVIAATGLPIGSITVVNMKK